MVKAAAREQVLANTDRGDIVFVLSTPEEPHQRRAMTTKNAASDTDDLRPEYDLSKLTCGVRGKYNERATAGTTLVLLEPDVAEAFPDGRTVNQALRALAEVARIQVTVSEARGKTTIGRKRPLGNRSAVAPVAVDDDWRRNMPA